MQRELVLPPLAPLVLVLVLASGRQEEAQPPVRPCHSTMALPASLATLPLPHPRTSVQKELATPVLLVEPPPPPEPEEQPPRQSSAAVQSRRALRATLAWQSPQPSCPAVLRPRTRPQ